MSELVDFQYTKLEREVNLTVCKIFSSINILELFLTSLGMSEVDTVRAWDGQTSTLLISKYELVNTSLKIKERVARDLNA